MDSYDLLIINGLVVTATDVGAYDIAIRDSKIAVLAPRGSLLGIARIGRVIDAEGGYVMVGSQYKKNDGQIVTVAAAWGRRCPCPSRGATFVR